MFTLSLLPHPRALNLSICVTDEKANERAIIKIGLVAFDSKDKKRKKQEGKIEKMKNI